MATDFETALEAFVGSASDTGDIRMPVIWLYQYGFDSGAICLWRGQGRLYTEDGREWLGTVDAAGNDRHVVPQLADGRDGSAAQLQFGFPFIDKTTFDNIKANREAVAGRLITCYVGLVLPEEGLRPATPIDFFGEYTMQSPTFSHRPMLTDDGVMVQTYSISVAAKNGNARRSQSAGGTYTDTSQQQRAALLGATPDYGCGFVARIANETLVFP
jgi:hypothetical protein